MDAAALKINAVVIEDDHDTAGEIADYLRSFHITVDVVDSGRDCLGILFENDGIDVIVSDIFLPDLSGIEVLRAIRSEFRFMPWLQFIMMTGNVDSELVIDSLRLGAVDFLVKPVDGSALVGAITRAAVRARQIRRYRTDVMSAGNGHAESTALPDATAPDPGAANSADRIMHHFGGTTPETITALWLENLVKVWNQRRRYLPGEFATDPAWDMLLDLLLAKLRQRSVSVTSLCIASGAPTTTALRRIESMISSGLVQRVPDPQDGRRTLVCLTEKAEAALREYLTNLRRVLSDP